MFIPLQDLISSLPSFSYHLEHIDKPSEKADRINYFHSLSEHRNITTERLKVLSGCPQNRFKPPRMAYRGARPNDDDKSQDLNPQLIDGALNPSLLRDLITEFAGCPGLSPP
jgi:hypothetical protein